jgi:uncharacterized membrane protein
MNLPKAPDDRLVRAGLLLVLGGLVVQIGASFFWSPGAFIVSAALGVPPVALGALLLWLGVRRAGRAARAQAQSRRDPS